MACNRSVVHRSRICSPLWFAPRSTTNNSTERTILCLPQLIRDKMKKQVESEEIVGSWDWLVETAKHGRIPIVERFEEFAPKGEWDVLCDLGFGCRARVVEKIEAKNIQEFWSLPPDLITLQMEQKEDITQTESDHFRLPNIHYSEVLTKQRRDKKRRKQTEEKVPDHVSHLEMKATLSNRTPKIQTKEKCSTGRSKKWKDPWFLEILEH